jgi:hypothetical protein
MIGLSLMLASLGVQEVGKPDELVLGDVEVVVILMKKVVPSCSYSLDLILILSCPLKQVTRWMGRLNPPSLGTTE